MKTVLVTGSAGFIGRHLVRRLLADGWEVHGLDIKNGPSGDCRRLFRRPVNDQFHYEWVIHCAAIVGGRATIEHEPMKVAVDLAIDADFFRWVLLSQPVKAIYFSSSAAYPIHWQNPDMWASSATMIAQRNGGIVPLHEDMIYPKSAEEPDAVYGWVKLTGERLAQYANEQGANIQVFRPFSGYGADQDLDYPFPSIIQRALDRADPFPIWGPGTQRRDWIHVNDVVEMVIRSLDHEQQFGPTNLCTGIGTSMTELARLAYTTEPNFEFNLDAPTGVMYRVGNPTKMIEHLGVPNIPLEDGIAMAMNHGR